MSLINLKLLIFTLIWPFIHLLIFFLRFQRLSTDIILESVVFLPLGLLSGLIFNFLSSKAKTDSQKRAILIGYIIMFPIAFIAALLSGLIFQPIIGVTIYGLIPLTIGMTLGYLLKRSKTENI